jgi:hypothetical protein
MASIWVEGLGRSIGEALDLLAASVRDCPGELWTKPMWPVPEPPPGHRFTGPDWNPVTEPARLRALARQWVERRSTPWSIAWHALESLDYDLAGEFGPWAPPPPFTGHPHWRDLASLPAPWPHRDVLDYIAHCRGRARDTLAQLTSAKAATPLPPAHRYRGKPHAWILVGLPGHTIEHAAQVRQFITAAGVPPGE